jgi:hypothetical protein
VIVGDDAWIGETGIGGYNISSRCSSTTDLATSGIVVGRSLSRGVGATWWGFIIRRSTSPTSVSTQQHCGFNVVSCNSLKEPTTEIVTIFKVY